jgi:hypothetical protein
MTHEQHGKPQFDLEKLFAVIFLLFKPQGRGANCRGLIPTIYQLQVMADLVRKPSCKFGIGIDSCLANHLFRYGELTEQEKVFLDSCEGSRMSAYISPSMKMMPCSYADPIDYSVQIDKKHDISYIWNRSSKFKRFRVHLKKNPYSCPSGF